MNATHASLWRRLRYTRLSDLVRGRLDASLDWRTVIAAADLPPDAAELVMCVVRRTRLWRSERVDVARELIAHFQDGLAAGHTSEQLVQSFGDPRQAARLIRRAKRRGRPLVWYVWHYGLWTVFAVLLLYALYAMCLLNGRPIVNTHYLEQLNAEVRDVAADARAWPLYREALLDLGCRPHTWEGGPPGSDAAQEARPGDARWPQAVEFLDEHQVELGRLREAAAFAHLGYELTFTIAPEDWPLLDRSPPASSAAFTLYLGRRDTNQADVPAVGPPLFSISVPHLDALRAGARLLNADIYRAVEEGDAATAYADVVALLGMSRQIGEKPTIIGGLVACAVEAAACDAIEHVLTVNPTLWSDEQLVDLAHRLAARRINAAAALDSERLAMRDMVQRVYTDDGEGDGTITYAGLKQLLEWTEPSGPSVWTDEQYAHRDGLLAIGMPVLAGAMASRAELEAQIDTFFANALADLQTPLWEPHQTAAQRFWELVGPSKWIELKFAPLALMMPTVEPFCLRVERARGRAEGVMIGLALELYHRENGHWSESLDELSPRWLPTVPVDRINGGPLGYRIEDDRPIVYSLGADGTDDGGRRPSVRSGYDDSYPVGAPSPRARAGDWVIWSTVPAEAAPRWEGEAADTGDGYEQ